MLFGRRILDRLHSTVPIDILIDDAQPIYKEANSLERYQILEGQNPKIRVLLLSMYSDRPDAYTPLDFPNTLELEYLRLRRIEFDEFVNRFIMLVHDNEGFGITIPTCVCDAIFNSTTGYPQLVKETLKCLKDHFRCNQFTDVSMLYYLVSSDYLFRIKELRVFDAFRNFDMTEECCISERCLL